MSVLWRDVEGPIKDWLRQHPGIAPLTGNGKYVYFEAPPPLTSATADRPDRWLTFRRLGGAPMPLDTPLDDALLSFSCFGRTRPHAAELASALANAMTIAVPTLMETVVALNGRVTLWRWEPDTRVQPPVPCFVVDAAVIFYAV
jgi:hypothetical protein